jgi:hypothetical protein
MRDSLLKALSSFPDMSQNTVFRAMNATIHVVAEFSRLFCQSMEVLKSKCILMISSSSNLNTLPIQTTWESMVNERRLLEVILQTNSVLDAIVTCADEGVTTAKLMKVCEETSPLLGYICYRSYFVCFHKMIYEQMTYRL